MRCYLSSFRVGDHAHVLTSMAPPPGPVGLIGNSLDMITDPDDRAERLRTDVDQLAALGYDVVEVDLRDWFDVPGIREHLAGFAMLYARGGNVFVLREALARSGADTAIRQLLADDAVVHAGYSAGICVLAPSLRGLEFCDPLDDVRTAYDVEPRFDGLGILDRVIVPHLDSPGHPETDLLAEVARHYDADGTPYVALRDGDVMVVDGGTSRVLPRLE